ncbi:thermonuclease family protein [Comamonadaceae bacterium M7527]|nr:thermonuclease family protein [Comamonadaceae bacterium M7527]
MLALKRGLLLAALMACGFAWAERAPPFVVAQAVRVYDGDSAWLKPWGDAARQQRHKWVVRLQGIDAPELCQDFGVASQQALAVHLAGQRLGVTWLGKDTYGRWLVRLSLLDHAGNPDVGRWMVSKGYAWAYRFKGDAGPYESAQQAAQLQGLGLFANPKAVEPRAFRRKNGRCR